MPPEHPARRRRGAIVLLAAFLVIILVAVVAFAVDLGYVVLARTQLQVAADAAALAGAGAAPDGIAAATAEAHRYAGMHMAAGRSITPQQVDIRFGAWDKTSRRFNPSLSDRSAIEVTVKSGQRPLFFGRLLGADTFDSEARAVATFAPRDIMLTLDFSGSMCFDSQLSSISSLGRAAVENSLLEIYSDLGAPRFGNMQWVPQYHSSNNTATVRQALGLNNVPYPYPRGSWDEFIEYVRTDSAVANAGYQKKYGYLTWVNYLQAKRRAYSDTPDLWKTREQPVGALKDAVDVFTAYLEENSPDDRLGLSLYTSSNGTAILESPMTSDFLSVSAIVRRRQAGHYHDYTNIYDGMRTARLEFQNRARPGARKLMVLMTDGQANLPGSGSTPRNRALQEARDAAAAGIPIITIALGADADDNLMRQIADITKGAYFKIPGGQSAADYEEQLKDVFRQVAADRNLMLVQ